MRFSGNQQHAGLSEIFQFRIPKPDQGGKILAVCGPMITLVERGREMPLRIQVFKGNLAQRKLLSHPSLPAKPLSPMTVRGAGLCQRLPGSRDSELSSLTLKRNALPGTGTPPGHRVERGAFSGNIARDIPKLGFEFVFSAVTLSYALLRESTARCT